MSQADSIKSIIYIQNSQARSQRQPHERNQSRGLPAARGEGEHGKTSKLITQWNCERVSTLNLVDLPSWGKVDMLYSTDRNVIIDPYLGCPVSFLLTVSLRPKLARDRRVEES